MANKKKYVTIIDPQDPGDPQLIPVTSSRTINLSYLKIFIPHVQGLKYVDHNKKTCAVMIDEGCLQLEPGVDEYTACYSAENATNNNEVAQNNRKTQVTSLLQLLKQKTQKTLKSNENSNPNNNSAILKRSVSSTKKINETKTKKARKSSSTRTLVFGWVHKSSDDLHFKQVTKPFGGLITIELESDIDTYSVEEVKSKVVAAFKNEKTESFFKQVCSIEIGLHDGQVFKEFRNVENEACDLWEFLSSYKFSPKTHLYLVTKESGISIFEHLDSNNKSDITTSQTEKPSDKNHNEKQKVSVKVSENLQVKKCSNEIPKVLVSSVSTIKNQEQVSTNLLPSSSTSTHPKFNLDNYVAGLAFNSVSFECNEVVVKGNNANELDSTEIQSTNPVDSVFNKSHFSNITIMYSDMKVSEYSGQISEIQKTKRDLFNELVNSRVLMEKEPYDSFDPYDHGYNISSISIDDVVILDIVSTSQSTRLFNFPALQNYDYHKQAYDIDQLQGFAGEDFGVGLVTTCTDHCRPIYEWRKDGKFFKKGPFLYWVYLKEQCLMECVVKCSNINPPEEKKKSKIDLASTSVIPVIKKTDFTVSSHILGAGAQGTVKKGQYLGSYVAVKIINIINDSVMSDVENEMNVMSSLRHPNIIQIMALCAEKKKVFIIMEMFVSVPLFDLLFDEDANNVLELTMETKNELAKQMCMAVSYLHGQRPPIIHKDIKTANIMVNQFGVLKLGDFGLSKICKPSAILQSTCVRGTYLYMAPEIYIHRQPASIPSDIWSLACSLLELYSQKMFGHDANVKTDADLTVLLQNGYKPNVDDVPLNLKTIIVQCFSLKPEERPQAIRILECLNNI